uniref:RNA exonuclease 4 n=1 Tax=Leptobrachium leishanense TaxID=445787 RepID=A0A8C5PUJ7_9ANUR
MAKVLPKKDKAGTVTNTTTGTKKAKQKKFWAKQAKKAKKVIVQKKTSHALPPKSPQEFSSNWKALQELLKPEKSGPDNKPAAEKLQKEGEKVPEKPHTLPITKKTPPKVNGHLKGSPPAAKEATKSQAGQPGSPGEPKQEEKKKKRKVKGHDGGDDDNTKQKKKKTEEKHEEQNKAEAPKYDIWFDDVDPDDIESALGPEAGKIAREKQGIPEKKSSSVEVVLVKERAFEGLTRTIAMDCEMVGVGPEGEESILARVSLVNQFGKCVYDKHVKPSEHVTDYRTAVSGIRPQDIKNGEAFKVVQKEVSELLRGRILVGHAVHNDLKILFLAHPKKSTRDTQKYKPFRKRVQIQDAQAAMRLYTMEKKHWEAAIKEKHYQGISTPSKKPSAPSKS